MPRRAPKGIELGRVGYLGPPYTFTHTAAREFARRYSTDSEPDSSLSEMNSNLQIIQAVAGEEADSGVVPYHNMIGGRVPEVLDGLLKYAKSHGLTIVDSLNIPISMCIGGKCEASDVRKIVSKDEAMRQCSGYLGERHPCAEWVPVDSTAKGMKLVADGGPEYEFAAALGAKDGFESFGIGIYEEDIANVRPNKTRFLLIKRKRTGQREETKAVRTRQSRKGITDVTTVAVEPKRAYRGLSYDLSGLACDCGVAVKYSYARPTGKDTEIVFLDLVGHRSEKRIGQFLSGLSHGSFGRRTEYVVLGSYPIDDFFEPQIRTIGVIGSKEGVNSLLADFYRKCGYDVLVGAPGSDIRHIAKKSDVIVANRSGRSELKTIVSNIGRDLGRKLLVVNSSTPVYVMDGLSGLDSGANVLFMDAPVTKRAPLEGQNIIFIGDADLTPGSIMSEFVGIYDDRNARVTLTDFETHKKYRDFSMQASMLSALFYLRMAERYGIDFNRLRDFASPDESILAALMQKFASYDRKVVGRSLRRYLQENNGTVSEIGGEISGMPGLSEAEIAGLIERAAESSTDVGGATKMIAGLYGHMLGAPDL